MQAAAAVNTFSPAPEASPEELDMFPADLQEPALQFEGVLIDHARVRVRPSRKSGAEVTVLCLDIRVGTGRVVHAEQEYSYGTHSDAERRAATLRKGMRVSVTHSVQDVRIVLPHVSSLHTLAANEEQPR